MGAGYCQWGGLTDRNVCNIPKIMPIGQSAAAGEAKTNGRKARKYIRIVTKNCMMLIKSYRDKMYTSYKAVLRTD